MTARATRSITPVTFVALAAASCGPQRRGELVGAPIAPDTFAEVRGERLFFRHCSRCHPGGEAGLGPALNDKPLPEIAIKTQIRRGLGAMPAFPEHHLDDVEVDAIAEYVIERRRTPRTHPEKRQPRDAESPETSASRW